MFQGAVDPAHRGENGMDYTSVPNIMKVIEPLFLDKLNKEFEKYYNNEKKLWNLLNRIRNIKIFEKKIKEWIHKSTLYITQSA